MKKQELLCLNTREPIGIYCFRDESNTHLALMVKP